MADDPADDARTIPGRGIVSNNQLKINGSDDADDADGVSAVCSGESSRGEAVGNGICAQCGQPGGTQWDYQGVAVRLHPQCEQPWIDAYRADKN